ncbi:MAG: heme-binding protein [Acidobacteriia bacterium]|nr:heme-binding protein [Terriglobia bacterium]
MKMDSSTHRPGNFLLAVLAVAVLGVALALLFTSCGGGGAASASADPPAIPPSPLSTADVDAVVNAAVQSVNVPIVVAVTDRVGRILAIFCTDPPATMGAPCTPDTGLGNFGTTPDSQELAVALARTASFFSNSQAPLSSRTVRFISGIHFPPGVSFTPNAALYGIENTNRGCSFNTTFITGQEIPPSTLINGTSPGLGIITGKADFNDSDPLSVNPGGVPIFKNGTLVGGVGVVAGTTSASMDVAEYAAFVGSLAGGSDGIGLSVAPPGVVFIDGIALPFVNQTSAPAGIAAGSFRGSYNMGPNGDLPLAPEGYLVAAQAGPVGGLTQAEVSSIVANALATANVTRAVIRLPLGSRTRMVIAVSDTNGTLLALNRMPDATIFSIDVAVAKSRNVIYYSTPPAPVDLPGVPSGTAVTNRTISFGAQPFFPPGIDGSGPGPFFDLYKQDTTFPCTQGSDKSNPQNQSGIVFFPGAVPLYRNGVIVGGLGVSGDGVEQDDFVTNGGSAGFEAPTAIRADQVFIDGVRLPYLKFPRDPTK